LISAIATAMADPCCQSLAGAQARFPESHAGLRAVAAIINFGADSERKHRH
jgi:hypothetical protein